MTFKLFNECHLFAKLSLQISEFLDEEVFFFFYPYYLNPQIREVQLKMVNWFIHPNFQTEKNKL